MGNNWPRPLAPIHRRQGIRTSPFSRVEAYALAWQPSRRAKVVAGVRSDHASSVLRSTALVLLVALAGACASAQRARDDASAVPVSVLNRTRDVVCYLYVSPMNSDSWSEDLLGSATVPDGTTRVVRVPTGNWDLRVENCDHENAAVLRGARIARGATIVLQ